MKVRLVIKKAQQKKKERRHPRVVDWIESDKKSVSRLVDSLPTKIKIERRKRTVVFFFFLVFVLVSYRRCCRRNNSDHVSGWFVPQMFYSRCSFEIARLISNDSAQLPTYFRMEYFPSKYLPSNRLLELKPIQKNSRASYLIQGVPCLDFRSALHINSESPESTFWESLKYVSNYLCYPYTKFQIQK